VWRQGRGVDPARELAGHERKCTPQWLPPGRRAQLGHQGYLPRAAPGAHQANRSGRHGTEFGHLRARRWRVPASTSTCRSRRRLLRLALQPGGANCFHLREFGHGAQDDSRSLQEGSMTRAHGVEEVGVPACSARALSQGFEAVFRRGWVGHGRHQRSSTETHIEGECPPCSRIGVE